METQRDRRRYTRRGVVHQEQILGAELVLALEAVLLSHVFRSSTNLLAQSRRGCATRRLRSTQTLQSISPNSSAVRVCPRTVRMAAQFPLAVETLQLRLDQADGTVRPL